MSTLATSSAPDPFRIFLSGSTADFGPTRISLGSVLARSQLHIIHQADFPQTQADTVLKLAQLIAPCGVLIHLIGQKPGSVADKAAVDEYLAVADKDGGFLQNYPGLRAALGDFSGITYTQWEVLIALHLGITVFVYGDPTHADPAHPQRAHLDRLVAARRYSDTFTDEADLKDKIWADLMFHYRQSLPAAQVPDIFRPSNLPGIYTGCLFLGREDFLRDLRASLLKQTHATAITHRSAATGIAGLGGIGKTHAAVEYARIHHADYTATLFISGDTPERLRSSLSALYEVLQLGAQNEVQPDESIRVAAVLHWFATNRDWLLIVDNVDDEASASALSGYFDKLSTGHVLITSCLQNWADNIEALNIEVLSSDASTDLLLQLTDKKRRRADDDAAQARQLAKKMDGLPLALHQAAGYINEQRITFAQYLARYEEEAACLLDWFKNHVIHYERLDKETPKPVLITWKASFDKLDADTRFWLLVFAHFAPDPIPEFLLDSAPDTPDEVKSLHRAALEAIAQAETYSLLTREHGRPYFKLHRLVQQIFRLNATEADRAAALAMGIQLFDENNLGDPDDVRTWPRWTPLQTHAVSLAGHAPDTRPPEGLSLLLNCLALLLKSKSLYAQAEPYCRRAVRLDEVRYGPDDPNVAIRLNNLATLLMSTNRLAEAEPLMRRVVEIFEIHLGEDHPTVASSLNNLAALLKETNRLADAEPLMRRALAIDEASYGPDHPKVALRLINLATMVEEMNQLAEAESLMRRALDIDEASYGPDHPAVASDLSNLAMLFKATNRLAEAEPLIRRSLRINEACYGSHHPEVAIHLNNLGQLLHDTNRLAEAEPLMRRALGIDEASYGPNHPAVARDLNNLASLLQAKNRLGEAEPLMWRALGINEASYGSHHPEVARNLGNLGSLLKATSRLAEAEPLMRRALSINEASYGPDHSAVARHLNNLASLLQAANRLGEAEPLMRRALSINELSYGPDHPAVACDLNNLALLLRATNRLVEAEPLMQRALAIYEVSNGPDHPSVAISLNTLASLFHVTNRLAAGEALVQRALSIDEASYGPDHPAVANCLWWMATFFRDSGRMDEAEPLMRRALGILVRSLGLGHPNSQKIQGKYIALLKALEVPEGEIEERVKSAVAGG